MRNFTDDLLEEVSKPFFATLHKWLFSGELYDPFFEFFVSMDPSLAHLQSMHPSPLAGGIDTLSLENGLAGLGGEGENMDREGGLRVWESKYKFRKEMLPMFVGETFGRKVKDTVWIRSKWAGNDLSMQIFSTGRSLNFIRYSCHDSDWVTTREKMSNTGGSKLS